MKPEINIFPADFNISEFDTHFNAFHELMSKKVQEILVVSSPYDAYIMEEDGSLASKIINEYRGLNLSRPPRVTRVASGEEALTTLERKQFDLVITMPNLAEDDFDTFGLSTEIKKRRPNLPIILLTNSVKDLSPDTGANSCPFIDNTFIWTGDSDLFLALVKSVEDRLNVDRDTKKSMVRVLILVEDSPLYRSFFLPLIYKEVVRQTQAVLEESLNEEHRLLKMRARPKILIAENYEKAMDLFNIYRPYVFGVISDTRFPRNCTMTDDAGFMLLSEIKKEIPHLPLLLLSSESKNREKAEHLPADFLDKNSPHLQQELRDFFLNCLGFGDFIFRMPDGKEIARASNLKGLEEILPDIPDEPLCYQAQRNRFSNWIMARSEITLATRMSEISVSDFPDVEQMRRYIIGSIHALRKWRQKGVVAQFIPDDFDPEVSDFVKIGNGSLGGKARGLSFMANLLQQTPEFHKKFSEINIIIPKTLIITTDGFESFITQNRLQHLADGESTNAEVMKHFLDADMPEWLQKKLKAFLAQVTYPLSVRSSSLWEDLQFHPYAGLYKTYMIPNNHSDFSKRLHHLVTAVKLVYASTYFEEPRKFSSSVSHQFQKDSMAVMIQQAAGKEYGSYFYPAISGIAQSRNFYPFAYMQPEEGVVRIVLGMGKAISEGQALRFSPQHPNFLPQFSKVSDILSNSQRFFHALKIKNYPDTLNIQTDSNLEKREVAEAATEFPVKALSSTYFPEEDRIRDTGHGPGPKVLTFAQILKYDIFPLPQVLSDLLDLGRKGMGCPVEFEFSADLRSDEKHRGNFFILQIKPMAAGDEYFDVQISDDDIHRAFCYSTQSLGHGQIEEIADIVYVKPDRFDPSATVQIASEISRLNAVLLKAKRPYVLVGFGRWGSDDRWLGIPVKWSDISGAKVMIELRNEKLKADPSQGSHFFQKITSLGIHYLTITEGTKDFFNWEWIGALPVNRETNFVCHVKLKKPFVLKNDGRKSQCVMFES
ncbi:MAG: phosphoenolpyruvate synthase/pyruvate phosphate dikinase [Deltaproteobacteria bacterium]|nr:phosphoenolpyruvate synthase/pyruvate phosphate dikinase [Deltaproteobacteria bacterium]